MKPFIYILAASISTIACTATTDSNNSNYEGQRLEEGYIDLFARGDFSEWTTVKGEPVKGWLIEEGRIHRPEITNGQKRPGSIISKQHYTNFELRFDWNISKGGNSGIKYRSQGDLGLEYQVLDDGVHQDPQLSAGIYALVPAAKDKPFNPGGQWNSGRIIAKGNYIEHWINDVKVAEIEIGSDDWKQAFENSKYKKHTGFGTWTGPIYLQDHNDAVSFRNVRIREL
ncbi:DUF1080 domain-containing protein [Coraliomargarita sp. SDUM461004]|uniref:DUF1080 domain-containing protein n=1 Tax=Thalassobacterium sedimentorum TaxID=3041258 RepID=A0ABU1AMV5_9BACT|nr:DUF1080 domain-containing protein [Coraliomargarita sp. SDUM461004]MDQ8196125.1 DUF1080 domain-containing protein [Coraliomargarita sp. SDUM461004]